MRMCGLAWCRGQNSDVGRDRERSHTGMPPRNLVMYHHSHQNWCFCVLVSPAPVGTNVGCCMNQTLRGLAAQPLDASQPCTAIVAQGDASISYKGCVSVPVRVLLATWRLLPCTAHDGRPPQVPWQLKAVQLQRYVTDRQQVSCQDEETRERRNSWNI